MSLSKDDLRQALDIYTANDPSGGRLFKVDVIATVADDVNATIVGPLGQEAMADSVSVTIASDQPSLPVTTEGDVADNAAQINLNPNYVGGKAVDATTYAPAYTAGDAAGVALNKDNGGVLVNQGNLDYAIDSVTAYGTTALSVSTVTFSVGGAGATGDYMGTSTSPQSFSNAVRLSGGTGIIKSISIVDKLTTAAVDLELWLYSATFTAPTDNAAWTISDTDALNFLGVIKITGSDWVASAANKAYSDDTISLAIKPAVTSLFYALVARGTTPAWTTGDVQMTLGILLD